MKKLNVLGLPRNIGAAVATIIDRAKKISTEKKQPTSVDNDSYCPVADNVGSDMMAHVPDMEYGTQENLVVGPPGQEIEL